MGRTIVVDGVGRDVGTLELPGSVQIGNDPAEDTLEVVALVASDIVPDGNGTRNLGTLSPVRSAWAMVLANQIEHEYTFTTSELFQHGPTTGLVETIEVYRYDADLYVGGEMTVWMTEDDLSPSGTSVKKYVFVNDATQGIIDIIGGAQAVIGVNPLSSTAAATFDGSGTPNVIKLTVDNTSDASAFPIGTSFLGRAIITLFKA